MLGEGYRVLAMAGVGYHAGGGFSFFVCLLVGALAPCQSLRAPAHLSFLQAVFVVPWLASWDPTSGGTVSLRTQAEQNSRRHFLNQYGHVGGGFPTFLPSLRHPGAPNINPCKQQSFRVDT